MSTLVGKATQGMEQGYRGYIGVLLGHIGSRA